MTRKKTKECKEYQNSTDKDLGSCLPLNFDIAFAILLKILVHYTCKDCKLNINLFNCDFFYPHFLDGFVIYTLQIQSDPVSILSTVKFLNYFCMPNRSKNQGAYCISPLTLHIILNMHFLWLNLSFGINVLFLTLGFHIPYDKTISFLVAIGSTVFYKSCLL